MRLIEPQEMLGQDDTLRPSEPAPQTVRLSSAVLSADALPGCLAFGPATQPVETAWDSFGVAGPEGLLGQPTAADRFTFCLAVLRGLLARYQAARLEPVAAAPATFRELLRETAHSPAGSDRNDAPAEPRFRVTVTNSETTEPSDDLVLRVPIAEAHSAAPILVWHSPTGRLTARDLARTAGHFLRLSAGCCAAPDAPLASHRLLSEQEEAQICGEWNATDRSFPREHTIPELFAAVVEQHANRIALVDGHQTICYRDLDRMASRVAHELIALGVKPGDLVGIALPRSAAMVVAMLGVLKAGAGYVPLDLTYPPERTRFMIEDTALGVLIAGRALAGFERSGLRTLVIDQVTDPLLPDRPDASPVLAARENPTAYVMYTSGSTGQPKGVEIPQRAIIRLVHNTTYVDFGPGQVFAQVASPSFDAVTFEVWGALLHGARLVIIPPADLLSPQRFGAAMVRYRISAIFLTSSLFNVLARQVAPQLAGIRHLMVGGDAVDPRWARHMLQTTRIGRLINGYGPTESTTFAVTHNITDVPEGAAGVPIGRPLANTRAFVLDAQRNLVPAGVPGELYLGGEGLAKGYWRDEARTAERFLWQAFPGQSEQRLYRTGDLARQRENGLIEHLGRVDEQVKVRGYRIELGEVSNALKDYRGVDDAIAVVRENETTGKEILAYAAISAVPAATGAELRAYLRTRLPDFAVPSFVMVLREFPLSPNGKVRRDVLPDPRALRTHPTTEAGSKAATSDAVEERVQKVWQKVLGLTDVPVEANFFDLGGNSLLAASLEAELALAFTPSLAITELFEHTTVRAQARRLSKASTPAGSGLSDARQRAQTGRDAIANLRRARAAASLPAVR